MTADSKLDLEVIRAEYAGLSDVKGRGDYDIRCCRLAGLIPALVAEIERLRALQGAAGEEPECYGVAFEDHRGEWRLWNMGRTMTVYGVSLEDAKAAVEENPGYKIVPLYAQPTEPAPQVEERIAAAEAELIESFPMAHEGQFRRILNRHFAGATRGNE